MSRPANRLILLVLVLLGPAAAGRVSDSAPSKADVPAVEYCELISHPSLYDGQQIRLRGVYSVSGKLISHFFSSDCGSGTSLWVDFGPDFSSCTKPSLVKRLTEMTRKSGMRWGRPHVTVIVAEFRSAEVEFVGKFHATNPYKHPKQPAEPVASQLDLLKPSDPKENYDYVFSVSCVERVKQLPKNAKF